MDGGIGAAPGDGGSCAGDDCLRGATTLAMGGETVWAIVAAGRVIC
jgi:hypothetical protein